MTDKEYQHALDLMEKGIRADEREKTIEECKNLVGSILKYYRDEYHFGVTFNGMCNNILNKIEQLKEQK